MLGSTYSCETAFFTLTITKSHSRISTEHLPTCLRTDPILLKRFCNVSSKCLQKWLKPVCPTEFMDRNNEIWFVMWLTKRFIFPYLSNSHMQLSLKGYLPAKAKGPYLECKCRHYVFIATSRICFSFILHLVEFKNAFVSLLKKPGGHSSAKSDIRCYTSIKMVTKLISLD